VNSSVRKAAVGEQAAILPLYEWLFTEPGRRPAGWNPESALDALKAAIEGPRSAVFVAGVEGESGLFGFCTTYLDLKSVRYGLRCWVEDLAVAPDRRSSGIGGLLLDAAGFWAAEKGATHLELDTGTARTDARRFYRSRGPAAESICYQWSLDPHGF
jgi:GNAT superfamily N-acetyltransferase